MFFHLLLAHEKISDSAKKYFLKKSKPLGFSLFGANLYNEYA